MKKKPRWTRRMYWEWLLLAEDEAIGRITKEELKRLELLSEIRSQATIPEETVKAHKRMMRKTAKLMRQLERALSK